MHPNPIFRKTPEALNVDFLRARGFGVLTVSTDGAPLASHIPFWLNTDASVLEAHLVRSNPIAAALKTGPQAARMIVSGADGYISPDWYEIPDQVPTWNYIAVHLTGELMLAPPETLTPHSARLSSDFEGRLAPKPEWTLDKMTPEVLARMQRQIVPVRMEITQIDGTWKLGQNKDDAVRLRAADQLDAHGIGSETGTLADHMRKPPVA